MIMANASFTDEDSMMLGLLLDFYGSGDLQTTAFRYGDSTGAFVLYSRGSDRIILGIITHGRAEHHGRTDGARRGYQDNARMRVWCSGESLTIFESLHDLMTRPRSKTVICGCVTAAVDAGSIYGKVSFAQCRLR